MCVIPVSGVVASRTQCATEFFMKKECMPHLCHISYAAPQPFLRTLPFSLWWDLFLCAQTGFSIPVHVIHVCWGIETLTPQFELPVQLSGCDKQKVVSLQRVCHSPLDTALSQSTRSPGLGQKDISRTAGEMPVRSGTWLVVMH